MAPRKPPKKDPATELSEKLLRVLQAQRTLGPESYPLTVRRLCELTDPAAPPAVVKKALNKRDFLKQTLVARAKLPEAPIALADDAAALAGHPATVELLLAAVRTAATHAVGIPQLKKKAPPKLQKPFQDAITHQIDAGTLSPTVGWVSIKGKKTLFLLSDLHTGKVGQSAAIPPAPKPLQPTRPFAEIFDEAFARLDRVSGGHNFVSLVSLRAALALPRDEFDAGMRELRRAGRYGLSAAEGRDGITDEQRAAAIAEEGSLLLFASRNTP